jgi:hypothetical protein
MTPWDTLATTVRHALAALALLAVAPAGAGNVRTVALRCVDGAGAVESASRFACDGDGIANGRCEFDFPAVRRARTNRRLVPVGGSRRAHLRDSVFGARTRLRLQCVSADGNGVDTVACVDGVFAATSSVGNDLDPVCDFDRACDGTCSFAFSCPLCVYGDEACAQPCYRCPSMVAAAVPVGGSRAVLLPRLGTTLLLTCAAPPAGTTCSAVTTTTTLAQDCLTDGDCMRFPEPCRSCIGGRCTAPSATPTFDVFCPPNATTTTLLPAHCHDDADCDLAGTVAGCTTVGGCGFCTE